MRSCIVFFVVQTVIMVGYVFTISSIGTSKKKFSEMYKLIICLNVANGLKPMLVIR